MEHRTLAAIGHSLEITSSFPSQAFHMAVTDSRYVNKDDLFFALSGAKTDGHNYLAEVASRGAAAAVVLETYQGPDHGLVLFKVPNVLDALQTIAKKRIERWNPPIVAVTGSVGKTTTKEFIATLLACRYVVGKAPGNANSQVGLAATILNLQGNEEVLVLEMGMTESGNIAKLIQIAPPTLAVVTKIGMAHAGNFADGIQGVAKAKAEILSHFKTKQAIIGGNAWSFEPIRNTGICKKFTASYIPQQADYVLFPSENEANCWQMSEKEGLSPPLPLPFHATHFLEDFSIAAAVARKMGLSWEELLPHLASLQSTGFRFAKVDIEGTVFINDAYNAGPESVCAALDNLPVPSQEGRRIAVLGGMTVDLGPNSDDLHQQVAQYALGKIDLFFCYGPGSLPMKEVFEAASRECFYTENMDELRKTLFSFVQPGDVVLIKGANRYAMWKLLEQGASDK